MIFFLGPVGAVPRLRAEALRRASPCLPESRATTGGCPYKDTKADLPGFQNLAGLQNTTTNLDALAKTRHTRESGYPGFRKVVEIPGFPFSRE